MRRTPRETVAFVLSGGASLGAIQVGMLRALYERGIAPDLIVGTSAGALNGAFIASRPQSPGTADELAEVWCGLRRGQVFPLNPLTGLLGFAGLRDHLVPDSALKRLIARHTEFDRLEDLPIPLHVVAVDVLTGAELRLSSGDLADAVLASAAIPGVLSPVAWGDRVLMDGGVANNTPISHAIELGATKVYVLPTGHACALEEAPSGALAMALHAISLLTQRRLVHDIERHRGAADLVVLPPPCPLGIQPIDFDHAEELIARALHDARRFLDEGLETADSVGAPCASSRARASITSRSSAPAGRRRSTSGRASSGCRSSSSSPTSTTRPRATSTSTRATAA
jgi:NTE family protein